MRVGLDVDGVLADFISKFKSHFNFTDEDFNEGHWDLFKYFKNPDDRNRAKMELDHPSYWVDLPAYPYVKSFVNCLTNRGYDICIVTSPWDSCKEWTYHRRNWILENVGNFPILFTHDKQFVNVDVLFDDKVEHIRKFNEFNSETNAYGILVDRFYIRAATDVKRINLENIDSINDWELLANQLDRGLFNTKPRMEIVV
mgnify:CR=1 FL=1